MPQARLPIYLHLVWATWERELLLSGAVERAVHRALSAECLALSATPIAIGGTDDHVHLLVCLPTTHSIADLIKKLKGSSAHLVTHQLAAGQFFKWQAGYGAVSVSPRHLTQVTNYIERQREHHARGTLIAALEDLGQPPPQ